MASLSGSRFERGREGLVEHLDDGRKIVYPLGELFNGVDVDYSGDLRMQWAGGLTPNTVIVIFVILPIYLMMFWFGGIYKDILIQFIFFVMVFLYISRNLFHIGFADANFRTFVTPWRRQRQGEVVLPPWNRLWLSAFGASGLLFVFMTYDILASPNGSWGAPREAMMVERAGLAIFCLVPCIYGTYCDWFIRRAERARKSKVEHPDVNQ